MTTTRVWRVTVSTRFHAAHAVIWRHMRHALSRGAPASRSILRAPGSRSSPESRVGHPLPQPHTRDRMSGRVCLAHARTPRERVTLWRREARNPDVRTRKSVQPTPANARPSIDMVM